MNYLIGIGTNQGNKRENIKKAIQAIGKLGWIKKISSIEETKAWGKENQDDFLNCVLLLESQLEPFDLLNNLLIIEKNMGRQREENWGPRIIDIDILWAEDLIINKNSLIIPHPFLHKRDFVLREICEIAGDYIHPIFKKSFNDLQKS